MESSPSTAPSLTAENYFDLLNVLSEVVVSTSDLGSILSSTVRLIQRMVSVKRCSILTLDKSGQYLLVGASAGIPEKVVPRIRVRLGEGIAGKVAKSGEAVYETSASGNPPNMTPDPERYSTSSFISVPIRHQDHTFGVINVTNKHRRGQLDPSDVALIKSVARFLGLAMERHRLYVETEFLHAHLERTVENLPTGLLTLRADGTLLTINPTASRLLRRNPATEGERHLFDCFPKTIAHCLSSVLDATIERQASQVREVDLRGQEEEGDIVPVRLTSSLVEAPGDQPAEVLLLIEDLTLRREVQELRRLDELKSNFIAMMSHELRTPLTSIRGSGHLLGTYYATTLDDTQRNLVSIIAGNTERLISIVNNILDISLLDSQSLHLELTEVDLKEVVRKSVRSVQAPANEKRIDINVILYEAPLVMRGDFDRLQQVFVQVLNNAIKFTPPGGHVTVRGRREKDELVVDVIDSGEGIPLPLREKVFEKFFQGDSTLTRRAGGTGTGLYLARALTELHGGRILAQDAGGLGAHIVVHFPLSGPPSSSLIRSNVAS